MDRRALTTFQAADYCGVHNRTINRWVRRGYLKAFRTPGGHFRILKEDLKRFIQFRYQSAPNRFNLPLKIMIIDDDETFREALSSTLLKEKNIEVYKAYNGYSTGWILGNTQPDVIIIDLNMKSIDGLRICNEIRESKEMSQATIIIVAQDISDKIKKQLQEYGANLYFNKPVEVDTIKNLIINFILKKRTKGNIYMEES